MRQFEFRKAHGSTDDIKLAEGGIDLVAYEDLINDFVGLIDPVRCQRHDCGPYDNRRTT